MKYFILFIVIGLTEILAITFLHERLGLLNSIYTYLVGTAIGGLLLYKDWSTEVAKFTSVNLDDRDLLRSMVDEEISITVAEVERLRTLYEPMIFFVAVVCVCVPGIVTDALGIFLAITPFRRMIADISLSKYRGKTNA